VRIHPSSVLHERSSGQNAKKAAAAAARVPTDWFIFDEMTRAGHFAFVRGVTAVSPLTVALFAGPNRLPADAVSEADASVQGE